MLQTVPRTLTLSKTTLTSNRRLPYVCCIAECSHHFMHRSKLKKYLHFFNSFMLTHTLCSNSRTILLKKKWIGSPSKKNRIRISVPRRTGFNESLVKNILRIRIRKSYSKRTRFRFLTQNGKDPKPAISNAVFNC